MSQNFAPDNKRCIIARCSVVPYSTRKTCPALWTGIAFRLQVRSGPRILVEILRSCGGGAGVRKGTLYLGPKSKEVRSWFSTSSTLISANECIKKTKWSEFQILSVLDESSS